MKILFVCRHNNGRSQMAMGIFNAATKGERADSAGYAIDKDGQLLVERAAQPGSETGLVIQALDEIGIDASSFTRKQTDPEMLEEYDKAIAILEPHETPEYFLHNKRVEFWSLPDPKGEGIVSIRRSRDALQKRVSNLLKQLS